MTTLRALSLAALASRVLAHVDINFPLVKPLMMDVKHHIQIRG